MRCKLNWMLCRETTRAMIKAGLVGALLVLGAMSLSAQVSLGEHGMSASGTATTLSDGGTWTGAFGVVHSLPTASLSGSAQLTVGWLHAHEMMAGDDCPADLNGDGVVSTLDLLLLLADFGCVSNCTADINGDGLSSTSDLLVLLAAYGDICP